MGCFVREVFRPHSLWKRWTIACRTSCFRVVCTISAKIAPLEFRRRSVFWGVRRHSNSFYFSFLTNERWQQVLTPPKTWRARILSGMESLVENAWAVLPKVRIKRTHRHTSSALFSRWQKKQSNDKIDSFCMFFFYLSGTVHADIRHTPWHLCALFSKALLHFFAKFSHE